MKSMRFHFISFHSHDFSRTIKKFSMKNCMDEIPLNAVNLISGNTIYTHLMCYDDDKRDCVERESVLTIAFSESFC